MGLPVSRRLRSTAEFARLRVEGRSFPGRYLVLNVLLTEDAAAPWRCGLITSRKAGGAVQRNRLRRQFREIVRHSRLRDGIWLVLVARWRAKEATFAELNQDWLRLATRARILLPPQRGMQS